MISIYNPYGSGITYGIDNLVGSIEKYKERVVCVYKLDEHQYNGAISHSFAVVFNENNTIGQFTVLLNHHGTNSGRSCGGTGSAGYCELMSCIENNNIELKEIDVEDIPDEWLDTLKLNRTNNDEKIRDTWRKIIEERIDNLLPIKGNYPINENWKILRKEWLSKY